MKNDPLNKLFEAAARAERSELTEISSFAQEQIVHAWRLGGEKQPSVIPVFRLGFAVSMAVACLTLVFTTQRDDRNVFDDLAPTSVSAALTYSR